MTYGNVNVDTVTTSTPQGVLGAGDASIMKNRIINGAMTVSQYNGTSAVTPTANAYVIDRFFYFCGGVASKFTLQQLSASSPVGFANYLGATSQSAYSIGSTDRFGIYQGIEGFNTYDLQWGTANAKTVTLSFWVQSSLTGTFGGSLQNYAQSRSYPFTYSIPVANTWTQISVTIAGDTTGTWVGATNAGSMLLVFGMGIGSTYSGTANTWASGNYYAPTGATSVVGTSGATFYITGVQLEVGSSATGFEYVNYQTSLANCQRYYYNLETGYAAGAGQPIGLAFGISTSLFDVCVPFPVTMRTTPSIYQNTGTNYYQFYNALTAQNFTSFKIDQVSTTSIFLQNNSAITLTVGQGGVVYANNTNCQVGFSAEL